MKTKSQIESEVRDMLIDERAAQLIRQGVPPWAAQAQAAKEVDAKRKINRNAKLALIEAKRALGEAKRARAL